MCIRDSLYYPRTGLVVGNMGCFEAASYYALQGVPQLSLIHIRCV